MNEEMDDSAILKQPSNDGKELILQWMKGINPLMNEKNQPPMNEKNQPFNEWKESTL